MKTKKDKPKRLTVHLSLEEPLLSKVDKLAEAERRTRLNMISVLIEQAVSQREGAAA